MKLTAAAKAAVQSFHPNAVTWVWLGWILFGIVWEATWLAVNAANTLSRQVWGVEGVDFAHPLDFAEWNWQHWLLAILLWLFFGWLSLHFPFAWLRG